MKVVSTFEADRLLVEFEAKGNPVPWKHEMMFTPNKDGKWNADSGYGKHSTKPNARLMAWKGTVANACRAAMGCYGKPYGGDTAVMAEFTIKPRNGEPHGSPATTPIKPNGNKQDSLVPDTLNLAKAVEDAVQGIAILNDVQDGRIYASKVYGAEPGVKVRIYAV